MSKELSAREKLVEELFGIIHKWKPVDKDKFLVKPYYKKMEPIADFILAREKALLEPLREALHKAYEAGLTEEAVEELTTAIESVLQGRE